MKKILITGATGFIGQKIIKKLFLNGHTQINVLTRSPKSAEKKMNFPVSFYHWNPKKNEIDIAAFEDVDTIIHLAGENIADGRWTEEKKKKIIDSRVLGSKLLAQSIQQLESAPSKIISASAIGYYGDCGDKAVDEQSPHGNDFLAKVCHLWEESLQSSNIKTKVQFIRIGMVLSKDGGAIPKMEIPFKLGLAGKIADGSQYMSWIHVDDLVSQFIYLLETDTEETIYNGVAPGAVTNAEFTKTMGQVLKRPTLFKAPKSILKIALGEMSTVLLNGQKVIPKNFLNAGFKYEHPNLKSALDEIFFYDLKGEKKLFKVQFVPRERHIVFEFFKDERNLERLTPPLLNFKVLGKSTDEIQEGTIIDYQLKLHGIPIKWKSLIQNFVKNESFTDQQLKGPYKKWVHQHDFLAVNGGTLMTDDIVYKVPFGLIGRIIAGSFVKRDVNKIFAYRQQVIGDVFNDKK